MGHGGAEGQAKGKECGMATLTSESGSHCLATQTHCVLGERRVKSLHLNYPFPGVQIQYRRLGKARDLLDPPPNGGHFFLLTP